MQCYIFTALKIPEFCHHTFNLDEKKSEFTTSVIVSYDYTLWKKFSSEKQETCRVKFVFKQNSIRNVKVKLAMRGQAPQSSCLFDMNLLTHKNGKPIKVRNAIPCLPASVLEERGKIIQNLRDSKCSIYIMYIYIW